MPKEIYKKTEKGLEKVGILPSLTEWNEKSNVGHTHAISDIENLQLKLDTISGKVNKSGDTMTGNLTIKQGSAINVSQYNDAGGVSLMNNGNGTATQFGSSARPARMFSSVQPEWYKNGVSQGVLAIKSDIPDISGKVNKAGDTMTGNLTPATNKGSSLGTSSLYWNNIYGTTIYENDKKLSDKYLGKTAKAADADKLDGNDSTYYLNYNNLTNRPTLGTAASKNTGIASGNIPVLDSNGKLADSVIPAVAITDTYVVATKAAMLALNAQKGDIAIRSDLNKSFVLQATPASTPENWIELLTPTDAVLSVNGKKGAVTLNLDDIKDGSDRKLANYVPKSLITTKGDMIYASAANTPARLGIGSNGQFLSIADGVPKWVNNPNTDTHYTNYLQIKGNGTEAVKFTQNADKTLNLKHGNNVSISVASGEITISATDTNTATAADNILHGSNKGTQITYAPYATQQSKLSFDTSTTAPTRTDRLNLNGSLYATKFNVAGKAAVQYNSTEDCIEFIFA